MSASSAMIAFKLAYQLSPVILVDGIAGDGGYLPIINLTEPNINFTATLTNVTGQLVANPNYKALDNFFANYEPVPGGTLLNQQIAMYPFANQAIAANAVIAQPLNISMMMLCPAGVIQGYGYKQTTMLNLQSKLAQHNASGGLYSIVTPAFIYTNCLMTAMRDISGGETHQVQYRWQIDFVQPLVTLQAAQSAYAKLSGQLAGITNGTPPTGTAVTSGNSALPVTNPSSTGSATTYPLGTAPSAASLTMTSTSSLGPA